jgi:putative mRNA 3-end processing factor
MPLLTNTPSGIYCEAGDFYIDPKRKVPRAVITHAHSDHARPGSGSYFCAEPCTPLLHIRLGKKAIVEAAPYGTKTRIKDATVSFHPAGHILGSAQVRVEVGGEVWVASGDYNPSGDHSCESFEPMPCDTFITECTFGLPIYNWRPQREVFGAINHWWESNASKGIPTVLHAYSLGKAQRLLTGVDPSIGRIFAHGAVLPYLPVYVRQGIGMPDVEEWSHGTSPKDLSGALVVIPPAASGSRREHNLLDSRTGLASGWMATRKACKQSGFDEGFVLSDHADWKGILSAVEATGASHVLTTHGDDMALIRYLTGTGLDCRRL